MRMPVSRFRLAITEVTEKTEVVNRGRVIGTWTPTITPGDGKVVRGDAEPSLKKEGARAPRTHVASSEVRTGDGDGGTGARAAESVEGKPGAGW